MKTTLVTKLTVVAVLLGTTSVYAQTTETRSVSASVAGALQGDTGFLTGGQVQVAGVGQGSVVLTRGAAAIGVDAGASSAIPLATGIPVSSADMVSSFAFDRSVNTAAALVGAGNVVAQGESLGGIAVVGNAAANGTRAGTALDTNGDPQSGSAATPTTASGSLVGQFSTTNTMQLAGQGSLFAGAQQLDIGERNEGISAGQTGDVAANAATIDLDTLTFTQGSAAALPTASTGGGAGFRSWSTLAGPNGGAIDINVANAGQGSVLVSASTGGFFGQGTTFSATAAPTFAQTNGFFANP